MAETQPMNRDGSEANFSTGALSLGVRWPFWPALFLFTPESLKCVIRSSLRTM